MKTISIVHQDPRFYRNSFHVQQSLYLQIFTLHTTSLILRPRLVILRAVVSHLRSLVENMRIR